MILSFLPSRLSFPSRTPDAARSSHPALWRLQLDSALARRRSFPVLHHRVLVDRRHPRYPESSTGNRRARNGRPITPSHRGATHKRHHSGKLRAANRELYGGCGDGTRPDRQSSLPPGARKSFRRSPPGTLHRSSRILSHPARPRVRQRRPHDHVLHRNGCRAVCHERRPSDPVVAGRHESARSPDSRGRGIRDSGDGRAGSRLRQPRRYRRGCQTGRATIVDSRRHRAGARLWGAGGGRASDHHRHVRHFLRLSGRVCGRGISWDVDIRPHDRDDGRPGGGDRLLAADRDPVPRRDEPWHGAQGIRGADLTHGGACSNHEWAHRHRRLCFATAHTAHRDEIGGHRRYARRDRSGASLRHAAAGGTRDRGKVDRLAPLARAPARMVSQTNGVGALGPVVVAPPRTGIGNRAGHHRAPDMASAAH